MSSVAWSRGRNIHDNEPELRRSDSFGAFAAELDHDRAARKDGAAYFCGPFNHDGKRSKENAEPARFLVFDIDGCPADVLPDLRMWFAQFEGIGWPTHSSTETDPHERAVLHLARAVSRDEAMRLGQTIGRYLQEIYPGLNIDPATFKLEQPVFMPPAGPVLAKYTGEALEVDSWLAMAAPAPSQVRTGDRKSNSELLDELLAGGGGQLHTNVRSLVMRWVLAGMDDATIRATITALATVARQIRGNDRISALLGRELDDLIRSARRKGSKYEEKQPLAWPAPLDLADLAARDPQLPNWIIQDWLPCGYATLLAGHGGAGKSTIGLTFAVAIAAGIGVYGLETERRKVLILSCEDRASILHWRLRRICAFLDVDLASLAPYLRIIDLVGHDVILWEKDPATGNTVTVPIQRLREAICDQGSELLVVDGISDTFGGNENARTDVKRYVNALVSLIPPDRGAVLILGHIDKATARSSATTEGYSGSTGWHNAVRARWYMYQEMAKEEDEEKPEPTGNLIVELQKSNLGQASAQLQLRWDSSGHVFSGRVKGGRFLSKPDLKSELQAIRDAFLAAENAGQYVPAAMQGSRTAYAVLASYPQFPGSLKGSERTKTARFRRHIEHLRSICHLEELPLKRTNRHTIPILQLTREGKCSNANA